MLGEKKWVNLFIGGKFGELVLGFPFRSFPGFLTCSMVCMFECGVRLKDIVIGSFVWEGVICFSFLAT